MKKADNFNPAKWLVENKITFQSRLNENFDLSNNEWRNWAISKNQSMRYDDLDSYEKSFVDKISDFINNNYGSAFDRASRQSYQNYQSNGVSAGFNKQTLTINGLDERSIDDLSGHLDREFGKDKFLTVDVTGTHFIKIERLGGNYYKLYLNPLYIKKYEKEALQFYDPKQNEKSR
jgi:hypothetical protein